MIQIITSTTTKSRSFTPKTLINYTTFFLYIFIRYIGDKQIIFFVNPFTSKLHYFLALTLVITLLAFGSGQNNTPATKYMQSIIIFLTLVLTTQEANTSVVQSISQNYRDLHPDGYNLHENLFYFIFPNFWKNLVFVQPVSQDFTLWKFRQTRILH